MKKAIIAIVFVLIVGAGALMFLTKKGSTPAPNTGTQNTDSATVDSETGSDQGPTPIKAPAATIIYTDDGFSPTKTTVKVGDVVAVKNQSSRALQFSSDPHPVHSDNKELNQQTVPAGGSFTFNVTEKGTFGYHDHLNESKTGTLVVE